MNEPDWGGGVPFQDSIGGLRRARVILMLAKRNRRRIPRELWPNVRRKLDQIDAVTRLENLKVPPGNRLHSLGGDMRGWHAVRVNDQYRIVFRFKGGDAFDVRCTDYH